MATRQMVYRDDWIIVPYIVVMVTIVCFFGVFLSSP